MVFNFLSILDKGEIVFLSIWILVTTIGITALHFLKNTHLESLYNTVGIITLFSSIGIILFVYQTFDTYNNIEQYGKYKYEIKYGEGLKSSYFTNDYNIDNGILSTEKIHTSNFTVHPNQYYKENWN